MPPRQFQETGESSFFGSFIYDRVVPPDHFLRQSRELIPWERFSQKLVAYYQGGAQEGRPPYDPALLLRMLLLSFLYNLSERQTEQMVNHLRRGSSPFSANGKGRGPLAAQGTLTDRLDQAIPRGLQGASAVNPAPEGLLQPLRGLGSGRRGGRRSPGAPQRGATEAQGWTTEWRGTSHSSSGMGALFLKR